MDGQRDDKLMTTREVAAHVRRTPDTVRRWAKRGVLRSAGRLPDGGWLFRMRDVEALLGMKRKHTSEEAKIVAARFGEIMRELTSRQ